MPTRESAELWIIQPLLEVGLGLDEVCELLFLVSFRSMANPERCDVLDATEFLGHRSASVRAAWIETVDRMLGIPETRRRPAPAGP